ncbi:MAG: right-handed parallel beta-helix repeat-containing protein [Candidatus Zixiibacteriota bacterium]
MRGEVTFYFRMTLILSLLIVWTGIGRASIIKVPQDFPIIQDALDIAEGGDTVMVVAGIYTGDGNRDLNFYGKALTMVSEGGSDLTIIDCGAGFDTVSARGFIFENGEDSTASIKGFTIKNGGIFSIGHIPSGGGGAYIINSSPLFVDCIFENNVVDPGPKKSIATVTESLSGGAVLCDSNAAPYFRDCIFRNNLVWVGGGAVYCYQAAPVFDNCQFINNFALRGPGAAILCDSLSDAAVNSCTFYGNYVEQGYGSGIGCRSGSHISLTSSIIAYNLGTDAVYCDSTSGVDVFCSNLYGNSDGDWTGCVASLNDSNSNMCMDPVFCDTAAADLHLAAASPCAPLNNMCGCLVGALPVGCMWEYVCGDANGSGSVNLLDVTFIIGYLYKNGPAPEPEGAADPDGSGNIDLLDITFLIDYLYRGGTPPICPNR